MLPAVSGLRLLGAREGANRLEVCWKGWLKVYDEIMSHSPKKQPSDKRSQKALTESIASEVSRLLRQAAHDLEAEVALE